MPCSALLPLFLFWCNQIFLCRQNLLCGKFNLGPLGSYVQQAWTSNFTRLLIPGTFLVIWLPLKTDSKLKEAHTSLWLAFSYVSWSTSRQPPACSLKLPPNSLSPLANHQKSSSLQFGPRLQLCWWLHFVNNLANIFPASDFLDFGETWTEPRLLPALVLSRHHFLDCASPEFIHGFVHCCNLCISLLFR